MSHLSGADQSGYTESGYIPDLPELPPGHERPRITVSYGDTLRAVIARRWIGATFFVLLAMAGMVSLGIWQIDRLQQRRAFNAMVMERYAEAPYDIANAGLPDDLSQLEYRRIQANGTLDYANQILLTNQPGPNGEPGAQLVAPLVFANGDAVLVARGWIPHEQIGEENWPAFNDPPNAPVIGLIQKSQPLEEGAVVPEGFARAWWRVDIPRIQQQMPYTLLPAFLLQLAEPGRTLDTYPSRFVNFTLDEGDHLSYSIQWFSFALILGFGYIQFVRVQESKRRRAAESDAAAHLPAQEPDARLHE